MHGNQPCMGTSAPCREGSKEIVHAENKRSDARQRLAGCMKRPIDR